MSFETSVQIRFAHVDPAGIVFYPRYFEMLNGAVEDWFAQSLHLDFKTMHLTHHMGVPTVRLEVDFLAPSELGDILKISVTPTEVGRSSCKLSILFSGDERDRLKANVVLVCMDLDAKKSRPWPDNVRVLMSSQLVSS